MKFFYKVGVLFFVITSGNIFAMAHVKIKNNSTANYEYQFNRKKDGRGPLPSKQEISFVIEASRIQNLCEESYIEFYDLSEDQVIVQRKTMGLCSFILYLSCDRLKDSDINYSVKLESKYPSTLPLKSILEKCSKPHAIMLLINEPLSESKLSLQE